MCPSDADSAAPQPLAPLAEPHLGAEEGGADATDTPTAVPTPEVPDGVSLPALALHDAVVMPSSVVTLEVESDAAVALFDHHPEAELELLVVYAPAGKPAVDHVADLAPVGVRVRVLDRLRLEGGGRRLVLQATERMRVVGWGQSMPYPVVRCVPVNAGPAEHALVGLGTRRLLSRYERLTAQSERFPKTLLALLKSNLDAPTRMVDLLADALPGEYPERLAVVQAEALAERIQAVVVLLDAQLDRLRVAHEVERKTKADIDASRREYYLRQQMKTIRKELGEEELSQREADRYQNQLTELNLDPEVTREAEREIERLRHIQPSSAEYQVIKTFLDRFFLLPWGINTTEDIVLERVRDTLDEGHHGLDDVKARILEFLAVRKLNPGHKGAILCFAGPPGVGKTSLGRAIAEAIGRKFFRISVGGVRDEAEIRGHRRTYVGAMPGKLLNGLTRAGCMNPLLMLDEIDKIGSDHRGDPAAALLEVLDPEQNEAFTDHYFNVPFDLSKVLFICTANYLHDIPRPLLDRLEVISIEGYTEREKLAIARTHLVPKVLRDHGLATAAPQITDEAIQGIVRSWTREAGVRNLHRSLEKVCRKLARQRVEADDLAARKREEEAAGATSEIAPDGVAPAPAETPAPAPLLVTPESLPDLLGPPRYTHDEAVDRDEIGVANGLAWTAAGGEVLVIEALRMPGHGKLVITGKLGEVMKESVQAAWSFTRSRAASLGIASDALDASDVHVHFPAGAVPKDGPSAGVTVTLALASLLSGRPVRSDFALTGEVTLRGKVLAVGGIKDKVLAAHRAGVSQVVIPAANLKDLVEVPAEVHAAVRFHGVSHLDEVFALALGTARAPEPEPEVTGPLPELEVVAELPVEVAP